MKKKEYKYASKSNRRFLGYVLLKYSHMISIITGDSDIIEFVINKQSNATFIYLSSTHRDTILKLITPLGHIIDLNLD